MKNIDIRKQGEIFDERMKIRREVLKALGIALPKNINAHMREEIRRSIINCVNCDRTGSCLDWLRANETNSGLPDSCPNKEVFQFLKGCKAR